MDKERTFRILLVDDEPSLRRLMTKSLEHDDYCLIEAQHAREALSIIEEQPVDLVLSDHQMPGMSGVEMFEALAKSHPDIVKILITGRAQVADLVTAVNETSLFRVLIKPFIVEGLQKCVNDACLLIDARRKAALLEENRKAVRRMDIQYYQLVESMQDAIVVTDLDGQVLYVNHACEKLWAKSKNDFIGQPFGVTLIPGESTEVDMFCPGCDKMIADMRTFEVIWRGQEALLTSLRDVTDRKTLENRLKKTVFELSKANDTILKQQGAILKEERLKTLIQMAGATAHELNQPLTVLMGHIDLLKFYEDSPENRNHSMGEITKAAERIADIIRKIQMMQHERIKPYAGGGAIIDFSHQARILCVFPTIQGLKTLKPV